VARFAPRPEHVAVPGFVYGGLIASLIDCHAMATAAAFVERAAGREIGDAPAPRFVTASLHVDYLKPTPHGAALELRAHASEIGARKVTVAVELGARGVVTARGTVVAVALPDTMRAPVATEGSADGA
jgi:acyl-coenzyme A thioesterase PaaI-like protein